MIAALDVYYSSEGARAAAVVFEEWESENYVSSYVSLVPECEDYFPGQFYLRELQPLLIVISEIREDVTNFVVDGYCYLSSEGLPGLGAHLANNLLSKPNIVGVQSMQLKSAGEEVNGPCS